MGKKRGLIIKVAQLMVVILLATILVNIFVVVDSIQGMGKVINYAGIVRGATQRLIKLEIADRSNDELIAYLDTILDGLTYGGGEYELEKLEDNQYLTKLANLNKMWEELKIYIKQYRDDHSTFEQLLNYSEIYFSQANDVVKAAEQYSEKSVKQLRLYEGVLGFGFIILAISALQQAMLEMQLSHKNKELSIAAYIDKMTGIPGRRSCEEAIWYPIDSQLNHNCIIMFDLNNLKTINDKYGHHVGDKLIKGFAEILYQYSNKNVFVGRFGGDEFLMITKEYDEDRVKLLLNEIEDVVIEYNSKNPKYEIQYAYGYEFNGESLHKMLQKADEKMYLMKKQMKEQGKETIG